jgi:uncharacterized membrane protein
MTTRDRIVLILSLGLILLLACIVGFDFTIALQEGRPPDDNVIELLQMSITGIVGIVAGYLAGKNNSDDENNC